MTIKIPIHKFTFHRMLKPKTDNTKNIFSLNSYLNNMNIKINTKMKMTIMNIKEISSKIIQVNNEKFDNFHITILSLFLFANY